MKKIHSFLMAAVLVTGSLTSCSSDDQESKTAQSQQEIKFSASAEATRGTVFTGTDGPSSMLVYAFKNTAPATNYIPAATYTESAGTYTCATTYYWPTGTADTDKLTFLALYPTSLATNGNFTYSDNTIPSFSYTASTTLSEQVDLMAAKADALLVGSAGVTDGKVALAFSHLLTQVVFKGYVEESANLIVNVTGIEIHNVKSTGTTTTGTALTAGDTKVNYSVTPATTLLGQGSAAAIDLTTSISNALMLIPQTGATAWATSRTTAVSIADNDGVSGPKNPYLKVSVKIQNKTNNDYVLGAADAAQDIYFPLSPDWGAGKKVTYTLKFGDTSAAEPAGGHGVGYDADGNPEELNATAITFSATVTDWVDDPKTITF